MKLGEPDDSGRRTPEIQKNSEFAIKTYMAIKSLGFNPENIPKLFNSENLKVTQWGTLKADLDTMETNLPGVFAAGYIVRGASLVVWAIKDGRDAANSIKKYLESKVKLINGSLRFIKGTLRHRNVLTQELWVSYSRYVPYKSYSTI